MFACILCFFSSWFHTYMAHLLDVLCTIKNGLPHGSPSTPFTVQVKLCPAHEESRITESKEKTMFLTLVSSLGPLGYGPAMMICCLGKSGKSERTFGPKQLDLLFPDLSVPQELPDEPLFKDNLDFIPQAARGETEWKGGWTGMPWGKGFVQPASFMWDMGACLKLQNMIENPRLWKILESSEVLVHTCSLVSHWNF